MEFTIIGGIAAAIGLWLLFKNSASTVLNYLLLCSLMGGSAAINLPALGGSSIQPSYFALIFLVASLFKDRLLTIRSVFGALRSNIFLVIFVVYGVVGAFVLPRMFRDALEVTPMKPLTTALYEMNPLAPSSQNITQGFYLFGTMITALCATMVSKQERRSNSFAITALIAAWLHIMFGVLDVIFNAIGLDRALDIFRNANYSNVDQDVGSYHRIAGIFPEPSSYAAYGIILLVFAVELWLRDFRPRLTGATALVLALIIVASTSSAGYIGVGAYTAILAVRLIFLAPTGQSLGKMFMLIGISLVGATAIVALTLVHPQITQAIVDVLQDMTTHKASSLSGVQRAFWAKQGLTAFQASYGLGIGPGSFRSSSLVTSILGSTGLLGSLAFIMHLLKVGHFGSPATHRLYGLPPERAVAAAAGWAAVIGLIPAAATSPAPDPGFLFAVMGGVSLAWAYSAAPQNGPGRRRRSFTAPAPAP